MKKIVKIPLATTEDLDKNDSKNNTVTFDSGDAENPTAWKNVATLSSKEKHSSLLKKISTMFSNVRYLYKILGTTDISALGTVTQALANFNDNVGDIKGIISSLADCSAATVAGYAADALAVKELNSNLIKVEKIEVTVTTAADANALGGYYAYIGNIKSTKGNHLVTIPIGSVRTDINGEGGVICKYHKDLSLKPIYTLNAPASAEYRCEFICLYTE